MYARGEGLSGRAGKSLVYLGKKGLGPEQTGADGRPLHNFYVHQYKAKLYLRLRDGENIFLTLCRVRDSKTRFRFVSSDSLDHPSGGTGSDVTVLLIRGEGGRGIYSTPEVTLHPHGDPARFREFEANLRHAVTRSQYDWVDKTFQPSKHTRPVLIFKDPGLDIGDALAGYRDDISKLLPRPVRTDVPDCPASVC